MIGIIQKKESKTGQVMMIPTEKIHPNPMQPRHRFNIESLESLSESIVQNGVLQPVTVRSVGGGEYELVAGERRLRASVMAGIKMVPCLKTDLDDKQAAIMSLIENLQRDDLDFFEEAEGMNNLMASCGITQEELAKKLGKNQSTIANKLRLLRLDNQERRKILDSGLTERHARALLRLSGDKRRDALNMVIKKKMNVQDTDRYIEMLTDPLKQRKNFKIRTAIKDIRIVVNTINNAVCVLKKAGIMAEADRRENDLYYEYIVKVPKN